MTRYPISELIYAMYTKNIKKGIKIFTTLYSYPKQKSVYTGISVYENNTDKAIYMIPVHFSQTNVVIDDSYMIYENAIRSQYKNEFKCNISDLLGVHFIDIVESYYAFTVHYGSVYSCTVHYEA